MELRSEDLKLISQYNNITLCPIQVTIVYDMETIITDRTIVIFVCSV